MIKENIRKIDVFGRWGGEEFIIICPHTDGERTVTHAERVRKLIEACDFETVGRRTASFGVTNYQQDDNINTILKRTDKALYKAKNDGRNRVVFIEKNS